MSTSDFTKRLNELYLPPPDKFVLVEVPEIQFVMIDGEGDPQGDTYADAIKWLFVAIHPMKQEARKRMGRSFREPPLECLWWADDIQDFIRGNREKLKWRLMIVTADWVDEAMFNEGAAAASERLGRTFDTARLESFHEGLSAQIMYVGPNEEEGPTIARLHEEFLPSQNLVPNGYHHEIYLTDPSRVAPEKRKTVLRQPVQTCG